MIFALLIALAAPTPAPIAVPAAVRPFQSLHLEVPYVPSIARIDGVDRLVYELHATNFAAQPLAIDAIDICPAAHGACVARIDPAGPMRRIGAEPGGATEIAPGGRAIFYLSIAWAGGDAKALVHRISLTPIRASGPGARVTIAGGEFTPTRTFAAALGAPLRGGHGPRSRCPMSTTAIAAFPMRSAGGCACRGGTRSTGCPRRALIPVRPAPTSPLTDRAPTCSRWPTPRW